MFRNEIWPNLLSLTCGHLQPLESQYRFCVQPVAYILEPGNRSAVLLQYNNKSGEGGKSNPFVNFKAKGMASKHGWPRMLCQKDSRLCSLKKQTRLISALVTEQQDDTKMSPLSFYSLLYR